MADDLLTEWLDRLGYSDQPSLLHRSDQPVSDRHPYALELRALLRPEGLVQARAVFDVERVPTVVFVGSSDGAPLSPGALDKIRKRVWNQNLASIVIEICGQSARAVPARKLVNAVEQLGLESARPDGPFSATEVATANLSRRLPSWFDIKARVDRKLLFNVSSAVRLLSATGFGLKESQSKARQRSELLMGQLLFLSYLEHRDIVGPTYRRRRQVGSVHTLVKAKDRQGIRLLIDSLREDLNGDFLGEDKRGFNPRCQEPQLTRVLKAHVERVTARERGLLGMWVTECVINTVNFETAEIEEERRTDIVYGWNNNSVGMQLVFEFKKLDRLTKSHKLYMGENGLLRFVTGTYSQFQPVAAMVGILLDSPEMIIPSLKAAFGDHHTASSVNLCIVSNGKCLEEPSKLFPHLAAFDTEHTRPLSVAPPHGTIRIAHMFLSFGYSLSSKGKGGVKK